MAAEEGPYTNGVFDFAGPTHSVIISSKCGWKASSKNLSSCLPDSKNYEGNCAEENDWPNQRLLMSDNRARGEDNPNNDKS